MKVYKIITTLAVIVIIGASVLFIRYHHPRRPVPAQSAAKTIAQSPATPQPNLDPLTIAAMRQRTYPSSNLTVTLDRGDQGTYRNATVSFTSDGLTEYALMSTPLNTASAAGWPVIILNHGFINPAQYTENIGWYTQITAALTHAGYLVIMPDYRGNGQSQGTPGGGEYSADYATDVLNLISSLKTYQGINPKRIGLLGHSMGASIALRVIVVSPDIKATAFMSGVVGSFYDLYYNWIGNTNPADQPTSYVKGLIQDLVAKYGDPKANPTFWDSASPINFTGSITGAIQVNHDINDSTVPKTFSDHLVSTLQQNHRSVEYYTYPGDDHFLSQPGNRALLIQRLLAFYQANL